MRLWPCHSEWPVTIMTNAWQTPESPWNPPKLLPPLAPPLLSMRRKRSTCKAPSIGAQTGASPHVTNSSPMSGILTNIWGTHLPKVCPHTHVAAALCVLSSRCSMIQSKKPKKHGRSGHSGSYLTESGNPINAPGYQPFQLSLSIYPWSIQQHCEPGQCFTQLKFEWIQHSHEALHGHLVVWMFFLPFDLKATNVTDRYHSENPCPLDCFLPKHILASSEPA